MAIFRYNCPVFRCIPSSLVTELGPPAITSGTVSGLVGAAPHCHVTGGTSAIIQALCLPTVTRLHYRAARYSGAAGFRYNPALCPPTETSACTTQLGTAGTSRSAAVFSYNCPVFRCTRSSLVTELGQPAITSGTVPTLVGASPHCHVTAGRPQ